MDNTHTHTHTHTLKLNFLFDGSLKGGSKELGKWNYPSYEKYWIHSWDVCTKPLSTKSNFKIATSLMHIDSMELVQFFKIKKKLTQGSVKEPTQKEFRMLQ